MKSPLRRFRGFAHHHHHRERKDHRPPPAKLDELTYAAQVSSPPRTPLFVPAGLLLRCWFCRVVTRQSRIVRARRGAAMPPPAYAADFHGRVDRSDLFMGHGDFLGSNDLR